MHEEYSELVEIIQWRKGCAISLKLKISQQYLGASCYFQTGSGRAI